MTTAVKPEGSLVERDFPELVQDLSEKRWTGVLILTQTGISKRVTVQTGRLVFASSTSPDDRMGELLLRRGRLTLRQHTEAAKLVVPGKRMGTVLIEQGVLDPKDLIKAVVEHSQEIIYGAFQWTEGQYKLQEGEDTSEAITLRMSTPDIIMEGIRRLHSWSRIRRAVGGIEARYVRAERYEDVVKHMSLSFEELSLLVGMVEPRTVEALCVGSGMPDFDVCRTLWAFKTIGLVKRLDPPPPPSASDDGDEGLGMVLNSEET